MLNVLNANEALKTGPYHVESAPGVISTVLSSVKKEAFLYCGVC